MLERESNKLRVAVVGCDEVAQMRHVPGFLRQKKCVSICAVCDTDQSVARNVAEKFGIRHVYNDLHELLLREKPVSLTCVLHHGLMYQSQ